MAVIRVEKNRNYTTMSNYHLQDQHLSLKAVGLLSKILSLPDDWDYTVAGLASICKEGKDAVRSALEELETARYIERRQTHAADGSFAGNEYIVYESPADVRSPLSGFPSTDKPSTGNPLTENPTEQNTNIQNTKRTNTPIVPTGDAPGEKKRAKGEWEPERFEAFWKYYPPRQGKRSGKKAARRAWNRLQPDPNTIAAMGKALAWQKKSADWLRENGRFIPMASTWINGRRWEDEIDTSGPDPTPLPPEERSLPKWT